MAITFEDINNINLENIGDLPLPVKLIIIGLVCLAVLFAGYFFINEPQLALLKKERAKEDSLKSQFELKQKTTANLEKYQAQLLEIEEVFGELIDKLPDRTEIPGVLEDISNAGLSNGLKVNSFIPESEEKLIFYAELPIEISLTGSYHQFAQFVNQLATLERIVTIDDFSISVIGETGTTNAKKNDNMLDIEVVAKTYRYIDEAERESNR